jgi:hypothetical protein
LSKNKILILTFPRYGLCNKLITWAKALVWCEKNGVRLVVRGWTHLPIGSILRGDRSWRWYHGFFKGSNPLAGLFTLKKSMLVAGISDSMATGISLFHFKATPYISDLPLLKDYQPMIKQEFYKMIRPKQKELAAAFDPPTIGIHIRLGDFAKIGASVKLDYFCKLIHNIRDLLSNEVPITVFSDGYKTELEPRLSIPNVLLFPSTNDLVDLLVFSSSHILVTSPGSSYSHWAAFISEGIVIHHPSTWVPQCRPESVNSNKFEGKLQANDSFPEELKKQLKAVVLN